MNSTHTSTQWITTIAGRDHHISGPGMLVPDNAPSIGEIAHSLALINRFTGHTTRPYSVAEHSLLVCDIVRGMGLDCFAQLLGLMHDAHEAFTGDMASPMKWVLGTGWIGFEAGQAALVRNTFKLKTAHAAHVAAIKQADLIALATERRDLSGYNPATCLPWSILDTPGAEILPLDGVNLAAQSRAERSWVLHKIDFLQRYDSLQGQCTARTRELLGTTGAAA